MWTLHRRSWPYDLARLTVVAAAVLLSACGGGGAAEMPDSAAGSGGSPQDSGTMAQGGGGTASQGTAAGGAGGGSTGSGGEVAMACPPLSQFTLAIHVVVDVSWPDTLGADGGSGKLHAWNLARLTANGMSISGTTQPCGSDLPELTLTPLVGGGKFDIEVPDAVWDAPSAPQAVSVGTIDSFDVGSTLTTEVTSLLVGLTMPDPDGPWPAMHAEIMAVDADGDDKPGFTGVPKSGAGYVQPPLTPDIIGTGPKADEIYMVTRTAMGMSGTLSSCTDLSGTVTVELFDNHIVGCHIAGGDECSPEHVDFLDTNRNQVTATTGTFTAKLVPDTATCADARGR